MSKHTLSRQISKELNRLNDRIDRAIIKGRPYQEEARRHRELLATLRHIARDVEEPVCIARNVRPARRSPVRRRLSGGVFSRLFSFSVA